jgi:transcriptional regulator with XRE-family HTH domain
MVSKTTVKHEEARRTRHLTLRIGEEIHRLRLDAGVSLRALSAATGLHPSFLARIEAAKVHASIPVLVRIGVALGADLSLRFYAGSGPRIHDRFQAPMIEELLRQRHVRWTSNLEVPVTKPSRGVVDVVLDDTLTPTTVVGEAQSEFRRLEEQIRWLAEKAEGMRETLRASGKPERFVSKLLVVRSTEATREIARRYESTLSAAYPAKTSEVVDAITGTGPWPGDGIVWMRVVKGDAELLPYPPRGVRVGR